MALGTVASGPGGLFLRLINSGDLDHYKFNQKTQNPDRLDTDDFDKLTLKIVILILKSRQ
jgi:hypothetical protein